MFRFLRREQLRRRRPDVLRIGRSMQVGLASSEVRYGGPSATECGQELDRITMAVVVGSLLEAAAIGRNEPKDD
jgi:hypothetical protein